MLALPDVVFENISSIEIGVKKLSLVETPPLFPTHTFLLLKLLYRNARELNSDRRED